MFVKFIASMKYLLSVCCVFGLCSDLGIDILSDKINLDFYFEEFIF